MGSNEGRVWVSLGGVGHVELSEVFFWLTLFKARFLMYSFSENSGGNLPEQEA